jgi:hypothetical protein
VRKGTLSDAQTLGMYEDGMSIIALCVHEGMTAYGVIGRLGRARKRRGQEFRRARRKAPQETFTSFDALREAVERLERATAEYAR